MRNLIWFLGGAASLVFVVAVSGIILLKTNANGFSARAQPSMLETVAAQTARSMAFPSGAKERQNPVLSSNEVIAAGRAHWADHCAVCHSNNGSGDTEMGRHMYPPAPDMRKEDTQRMSDGELFYIIENGIRLSGMPAWGGAEAGEQDSWKLVHFIRHLSSLSPEEIKEMEKLNPKSPDEQEEENEEEQFLKGKPVSEGPKQHQHH
jgi:mono/diheme cytochrome c family protein